MFKKIVVLGAISLMLSSGLEASPRHSRTYVLKVANSGNMPISPVLAYASYSEEAYAQVGEKATDGFVQICQTGNNSLRHEEVKKNKNTLGIATGDGPIFPGESKEIELEVKHAKYLRSITIESMYGRSKDICAVASIGPAEIYQLNYKVVKKQKVQDRVIATGKFSSASVESFDEKCEASESAASCLRNLSEEQDGVLKTFTGYLPSVLNSIEKKFSSSDIEGLLIPSSGAVSLSVSLK
ncbi:MAG: hypothetical protein VX642_16420 [Bdellovibrionota bacterium]|nr:hypothetical protein [Bdellovibrionota bacterium]